MPEATAGSCGAVRLEWNQGAYNYDFCSFFHDGHFRIALPSSSWGWWIFFILSTLGSLGLWHCRRIGTFLQGIPTCAFKSLFENFSFTYMIFAWALVLVTNAMKSSLSTLGMSSQNMASPVACLRPDKCMMGRPTGSWRGWSESTLCRGIQELTWKTLIFRSGLANYPHSWFRIEKWDGHPRATDIRVGQMMSVAT